MTALVDRADADLADLVGADRRRAAAESRQRIRADAAQAGHRHAVDVAGRRDLAGVEVGMRVQPQHAQLLAGVAAVVRDRGDGTDAQAVVAAEQHRDAPAAQLGADRLHHQPVPGDHLFEVAVAVLGVAPGIAGAAEVAAIDHLHAALGQRFAQAGDAQRVRPHQCAAVAGTDVGGRADQRDPGCGGTHRVASATGGHGPWSHSASSPAACHACQLPCSWVTSKPAPRSTVSASVERRPLRQYTITGRDLSS